MCGGRNTNNHENKCDRCGMVKRWPSEGEKNNIAWKQTTNAQTEPISKQEEDAILAHAMCLQDDADAKRIQNESKKH